MIEKRQTGHTEEKHSLDKVQSEGQFVSVAAVTQQNDCNQIGRKHF